MKYYEMHEDVYQDLTSKGYVSWDRKKEVKELLEHETNIGISKNLSQFIKETEGKKALDLGTGTGTSALFLSTLGFDVTGYDISATAIDMAKENAKKLNLKINFEVKDLLNFSDKQSYNLIVDSCLLHCIVFDEERKRLFESVQSSLTQNGYFFIHTMIESEDMSEMTDKDYLFLEEEILWSTGKATWEMDWHDLNGKKVFAHRRIRSLENLKNEFEKNGFKVVDFEINHMENNISTFLGWLQKA
jgi:cyclopropane fatty-acyl-phospholipid synthase-like methyltransferase